MVSFIFLNATRYERKITPSALGKELAVEYVVAHGLPLLDAYVRVVFPVDPQVNAALIIFFFGLGKVLKVRGGRKP